ncbi:MAG TPA: hypothetical protein VD969_21800 [Symbiobacteriaceae bacterium]|nr:hypothetical protein [Symbiobacteriaceae bacterium]
MQRKGNVVIEGAIAVLMVAVLAAIARLTKGYDLRFAWLKKGVIGDMNGFLALLFGPDMQVFWIGVLVLGFVCGARYMVRAER